MSIENVSKDTDKIIENVPDFEGQKQGTEYSLSPKEEYLGSVPESSEEQVQVQGGYASAPCNPVTLSFTLNLGAYKKERR